MRVGARAICVLSILSLIALSIPARAEEGGSGHYLPGAMADFVDVLPGAPGFGIANFPFFYEGSGGKSRALELGGQVAVNVKATFWGDTSLLLYETPWQPLGGSYATAIAIPLITSLDIKGNVQVGPLSVRRNDTASGISDIEFFPAMLVWNSGDLKWGTNFGIFAPTGGFAQGNLANTGKNYWTFEPGVNISYLSTTTGLEVTGFAAFDFNTQNNITNYQTGTQFHLDATVAQHLPLWGGIAGAGVSAFYYQQITGDSGSGAVLGSFEGNTVGLGPVLSYAYKLNNVNLVAEAKWLPEVTTDHRLQGNFAWIKLALNVPL